MEDALEEAEHEATADDSARQTCRKHHEETQQRKGSPPLHLSTGLRQVGASDDGRSRRSPSRPPANGPAPCRPRPTVRRASRKRRAVRWKTGGQDPSFENLCAIVEACGFVLKLEIDEREESPALDAELETSLVQAPQQRVQSL